MSDTIVTFTRRSVEEILSHGGSLSWRLSPVSAREATYLVCTKNKKHKRSEGPESHGAGFLIGRITGIVPSPEDPNGSRYLIKIGEWARIDRPSLWTFGRNPVHYTKLADLGIDPTKIKFAPVPKPKPCRQGREASATAGPWASNESLPLTIDEAKRGLAATFGVGVEAIEITIRG